MQAPVLSPPTTLRMGTWFLNRRSFYSGCKAQCLYNSLESLEERYTKPLLIQNILYTLLHSIKQSNIEHGSAQPAYRKFSIVSFCFIQQPMEIFRVPSQYYLKHQNRFYTPNPLQFLSLKQVACLWEEHLPFIIAPHKVLDTHISSEGLKFLKALVSFPTQRLS